MIAELKLDIYSKDGKKVIGQKALNPVVLSCGRTDFAYIAARSALVERAVESAERQCFEITGLRGRKVPAHTWNSIFSSTMDEMARPLLA